MGQSIYPAPSAGKTNYYVTLTSGTSWTVPAGVTYINATLIGAGGGGGGGYWNGAMAIEGSNGSGGSIITSSFATTPGASITYSIGSGGGGGGGGNGTQGNGGSGGNTTMTGATSATGGYGGSRARDVGVASNPGLLADNAGTGGGTGNSGGSGGAGMIIIEYWV